MCQGPTCNIFRYGIVHPTMKELISPFDTCTIGLLRNGELLPSGWNLIVYKDELIACCGQCINFIRGR